MNALELQWETCGSNRVRSDEPYLPPGSHPTLHVPENLVYTVPDLENSGRDLDVYATSDVLLAEQRQQELVPEADHPDLDPPIQLMQGPYPGKIRSRAKRRSRTGAKSIASRCAGCRFAGISKVLPVFVVNFPFQPVLILLRFQPICAAAVGSVCARCRRLESSVTRRRARKRLDEVDGVAPSLPEFLLEPAESLSLPDILFFELGMFPPICPPRHCPCKVNMAGISRNAAASCRSARRSRRGVPFAVGGISRILVQWQPGVLHS